VDGDKPDDQRDDEQYGRGRQRAKCDGEGAGGLKAVADL
jgi:hypothetical protein